MGGWVLVESSEEEGERKGVHLWDTGDPYLLSVSLREKLTFSLVKLTVLCQRYNLPGLTLDQIILKNWILTSIVKLRWGT
jgi:hypothetical protein